MFLVTGITGQVGGAAARHLLGQGKQVRALVRDPKKAAKWADRGVDLVQGDWRDAAAIASALKEVEGAYLMMPPTQTPSAGFPEAKVLIAGYAQALRQTPPPRLVVLSSVGSEKESGLGLITSTHLLEQGLADVPFPVAFVRAGSFYENYLFGLQTGLGGILPTFYVPTDRRLPMIATEDIGAQVSQLLVGAPWTGKKIVELGTLLSPDELAAQLGEVLGRDGKAQAVPREAWAGALESMGLPKGSTWAYEEMLDGINSGWIAFGLPGAEHVEGTTSAKQVFQLASQK